MNRIKFWIRPVTIFTVLGLIIGLVHAGTTTVNDGKIIQSDSLSQWIGHVLFTMFAGLVLVRQLRL
ncbi:hypothetical protein JZ785_19035 [Alicyclobacillus curvatus]|nr:hypothetical protein JZ785_19035 [Alicyclobacillus curvatus]